MNTEFPEKKNTGTAAIVGAGLVVLGALGLFSRFVPAVGELLWAATFAGTGALLFKLYRNDVSRWWLLIPSYGLAALGGLVGLSLVSDMFWRSEAIELLIASYIFAAIALPFYYLYRTAKFPAVLAAVLGGPFALLSMGFLLGAIGPAIPALMIAGGLYLLVRQRGQKQLVTAPAAIAAPASPVSGFEPIGVPQQVTVQSAPLTGPAADKPRP
jgi:hypothetical protein